MVKTQRESRVRAMLFRANRQLKLCNVIGSLYNLTLILARVNISTCCQVTHAQFMPVFCSSF